MSHPNDIRITKEQINQLIDLAKEKRFRGTMTLNFDGEGNDPFGMVDVGVKGQMIIEFFHLTKKSPAPLNDKIYSKSIRER
jgi:hypothetical protein